MYKLLFIAFFFFLTSCTNEHQGVIKNDNSLETTTVPNVKQNEDFNSWDILAEEPESFQINIHKENSLICKEGTKIYFPAFCFGGSVRNIKVEVIECFDMVDLIRNNIGTFDEKGEILHSDGMLKIDMYDSLGNLLSNSQKGITVELPYGRKDEMSLFDGIEIEGETKWRKRKNSEGFILPKSKLTINENDSINVFEPQSFAVDSLSQNSFEKSNTFVPASIKNENLLNYKFQITGSGWVNCDKYVSGKTNKVVFDIPESGVGSTMYVFFDNLNSAIPPKKNIKSTVSIFALNEQSFKVLLVKFIDKKIFYSLLPVQNTKNSIRLPELKPITRKEYFVLISKEFGEKIFERNVGV